MNWRYDFSDEKKTTGCGKNITISPGKIVKLKINIADKNFYKQRDYAIQLPKNYSADKAYPLVVYFHGQFDIWPATEGGPNYEGGRWFEYALKKDFIMLAPKGMSIII